jgi:hypothetical protein
MPFISDRKDKIMLLVAAKASAEASPPRGELPVVRCDAAMVTTPSELDDRRGVVRRFICGDCC